MKRSTLFQFRVSEDELTELRRDAEWSGDSVSNWIRRCIRVARTELRRSSVATSGPSGNGVSAGAKPGVSSGRRPAKSSTKGKKNGKQKTARKRH